MRKSLSLIVIATIAFSHCTPVKKIEGGGSSAASAVSSSFPAGWVLYDIPNTGDQAGRIIRVSSDGQKHFVTDLGVSIKEDDVILKNYSGNRTSSLSIIAGFLGLKNFNLNASDSFLRNTNVNYVLKIGQGKRDYTGDLEVGTALAQITPTILADQAAAPERKNDMYYVIRESIRSQNYEFKFGKDVTGNQELKLAFQKLANARQGYNWTSADSADLSFTNSTIPYRILYSAERIRFKAGANGATVAIRGDQAKENDIEK